MKGELLPIRQPLSCYLGKGFSHMANTCEPGSRDVSWYQHVVADAWVVVDHRISFTAARRNNVVLQGQQSDLGSSSLVLVAARSEWP